MKKPNTSPTRKPPVTFSQKIFTAMMHDIMTGSTIREVCSGTKRPTLSTFYAWIHKDHTRAEQYLKAKEIATDTLEGDILHMAKSTTSTSLAVNKARFEMLRWVMARRVPKRYGDKQQIEHDGENAPPIHEIRRVIIYPDSTRPTPPHNV